MTENDIEVMFSRKSDEWETPKDFFTMLNDKYEFTLDPCATKENAKCKKFYTKEDDGLSKSWREETVFVNPPYSDVSNWVRKAFQEAYRGSMGSEVVMLLPARTDTKWFHEYCMNAEAIYFVKGRLKFGSEKNSAPFPSMVVLFRKREDDDFCGGFARIAPMDRK
ncbi:MAG: DNA N-6-adenine-methyltransferase [Nanoarchaeota archaeon]|nr:DNA N-6-adenine-methyltransferase [Nanoarchaeota archaeon]